MTILPGSCSRQRMVRKGESTASCEDPQTRASEFLCLHSIMSFIYTYDSFHTLCVNLDIIKQMKSSILIGSTLDGSTLDTHYMGLKIACWQATLNRVPTIRALRSVF
jgi:hypothetical protein